MFFVIFYAIFKEKSYEMNLLIFFVFQIKDHTHKIGIFTIFTYKYCLLISSRILDCFMEGPWFNACLRPWSDAYPLLSSKWRPCVNTEEINCGGEGNKF